MRYWSFTIGLLLCSLSAVVMAQNNGTETISVKSLSAEEQSRLERLITQPIPEPASAQTIGNYFAEKARAADLLGNNKRALEIYREWEAASPDTLNINNYIIQLNRAGLAQEAMHKRESQIQSAGNGLIAQRFRNNYALELMDLGRTAETEKQNTVVAANLARLKTQALGPWGRVELARIQARYFENTSLLNSRAGKLEAAVANATESVAFAREGVKLALETPPQNGHSAAIDGPSAVGNLISALSRSVAAYKSSSDFDGAESMLGELLKVSKDALTEPRYLPDTYRQAADLRLALREFTLAQALYEKADSIAAAQALEETTPLRTSLTQGRVLSLEGQHRFSEALVALEHLDQLATGNAGLIQRVKMPFARGYAYLMGSTRYLEASQLFAGIAIDLGKTYPEHHFYLAQARGLQGVALWRLGGANQQAQAFELLRTAVSDYMRSDNLQNQSTGVSKDIRDLLFSTYLSAAFERPDPTGKNAMEAMVSADWVRGGLVQEALTDAAVRAAADNAAIADWVRADQDAKHEIESLRNFLASNMGSAHGLAPDVVVTMRERIAALDKERRELQIAIQARAPEYEKLVRPAIPTLASIAAALAPDEVLVMLLPTDNAAYVWAIGSDGKLASAKVETNNLQLANTIHAMRQTLDFSAMGGRMVPFDTNDAYLIYKTLLAPLTPSLTGKKHLIVAAGGALGQIPFGLLLTAPSKISTAQAPWLIRQMAITHVPTLSAWLALKQFAKSGAANESFIAWGDPQFDTKRPKGHPLAAATRDLHLPRSTAVRSVEGDAPDNALQYSDIPALPETREELLSIAAALRADPTHDLHLGAQATKASVLESSRSGELQRKKVIAFATHGLVPGDLPHLNQPALALAGTGNESTQPLAALLTLDDVLKLKLNADWVILSACNTAAADGKADEALSGLARGFFYAGSRSMLVTHWSVESESAKQLTTQTIDHYVSHPTERKAESLRQAMLSLMRNPSFDHPAFWAPYALVGDGGR